MSTKHTAGEWKARCVEEARTADGNLYRKWTVDPNVADIFYETEQGEANARLIAASPDLLEAAKLAYKEIDERYDVDQPAGEPSREIPFEGAGVLLEKLRAAIAKTETGQIAGER